MKTPRELLLERHRSAETKLDGIREFVVAGIDEAHSPLPQPATSPRRVSLREVVSSLRWHLAGLGAAWLVVLLLNVDRSPDPLADLPRERIPAPRQLLASLQAYRRQLLEALEPPVIEPATVPPRRSECRPAMEMV